MQEIQFSELLTISRERRGLTQAQLAGILDIHPETYRNYEKGRRIPNAENYFLLCTILELNLNAYQNTVRWEKSLELALARLAKLMEQLA